MRSDMEAKREKGAHFPSSSLSFLQRAPLPLVLCPAALPLPSSSPLFSPHGSVGRPTPFLPPLPAKEVYLKNSKGERTFFFRRQRRHSGIFLEKPPPPPLPTARIRSTVHGA